MDTLNCDTNGHTKMGNPGVRVHIEAAGHYSELDLLICSDFEAQQFVPQLFPLPLVLFSANLDNVILCPRHGGFQW